MPKVQAHFRLPKNIIDALKKKAEEDGVTQTDLVTRILQEGLGIKKRQPQQLNIEEIEDKILERVLRQIPKVDDIPTIEARISERILDRVSKLIKQELETNKHRSLNEKKKDNAQQSIIQNSILESIEDGIIGKPVEIYKKINDILRLKGKSQWNTHKLRDIKNRQITYLKKDKNKRRLSPLPIEIENLLIDWIPTDKDTFKNTSTGNQWFIQLLPENTEQRKLLIDWRREEWSTKQYKDGQGILIIK